MFYSLNSKIGEEQSAEDAEDGPPELLVCIRLNIRCILHFSLVYLTNGSELQVLACQWFQRGSLGSYCEQVLTFIKNVKYSPEVFWKCLSDGNLNIVSENLLRVSPRHRCLLTPTLWKLPSPFGACAQQPQANKGQEFQIDQQVRHSLSLQLNE